ncbi:HEPN domain-containing protein [Stenotrophomonas acidaminiphila]|uniref:HEPN domain-containing protein n=1 Tax=Stenotrophomonas acidaminiphila TaxID=128780 RepID=UPI0020C617B0|nr:HEPN domain-containing protein [Stenotrophomonas acidaminiphila]
MVFSFSFAVKLTDCKINSQSPEALFDLEGRMLRVVRKEDSVLLVSSDGYSSLEGAQQQLAAMLIRTKVALLKLNIPHLDWWSVNSTQRLATSAIGSLFEKANIVPVSYMPQTYETQRHQHWPGAMPACAEFDLGDLAEIALPDSAFKFGTARTLEALNVLGLALADPHARSKLILAMTAVEILSVRGRVESDVEDALNALKAKVSEIQAADEVKQQLKKVLGEAKRESIGKAGKRLVQTVLGDESAEEFDKLYKLRSEIVHGNDSRLSINIQEHAEIEQKADKGFRLALNLTLSLCGLEY